MSAKINLDSKSIPQELYRARSSCVNFDSARHSQIEAERSERARPLLDSKASEEDRFGEVAASQNSHNLTGRGISPEKQSVHRGRLIINLMGIPGSGKGTQGTLLSEKYRIPHIAIGEILNREKGTPLATLIDFHKKHSRKRIPDTIAIGLLAQRISQPDCEKGFILDGFPRTVEQSVVLIKTFFRDDDLHIPISLDITEEGVYPRVLSRSLCESCGKVYRVYNEIKKTHCLECKTELIQRKEDIDRKTLAKRCIAFNKVKDEIFTVLQKRDDVIHLNVSEKNPEEVFEIIDRIVQQKLSFFSNPIFNSLF